MPGTVVAVTKTLFVALDSREASILGLLQLEYPPLEFATGSPLESVRESIGMEVVYLRMGSSASAARLPSEAD